MVIKKKGVKKENRIIEWLRVKENRNLLGNIFLLGFFTIYLFIFIALCSFIPIFSTIILQSFIEYSPIPQGISIITLILYIIGILPVYGILKFIIKIIENSKKLKNIIPASIRSALKKINFYFILSILMIYVIVTVGLNIYQSYYKNDLPFSFDFSNNNYNLTITSSCTSDGKLSIFTDGDEVSCDVKVNSKSNCSFDLKEIDIYDKTRYNETILNTFNKSIHLPEGFINESSLENINLSFPITATVLHHTIMSFDFICSLCQDYNLLHSNERIIINSTEETYIPVTREMYENIRNQRLAILVLIFSVGVVSVLTSVKNLRDIVENYK
jgi:hypothetical protein